MKFLKEAVHGEGLVRGAGRYNITQSPLYEQLLCHNFYSILVRLQD